MALFNIPETVNAVITSSHLMAFNIAIQHAISGIMSNQELNIMSFVQNNMTDHVKELELVKSPSQ